MKKHMFAVSLAGLAFAGNAVANHGYFPVPPEYSIDATYQVLDPASGLAVDGGAVDFFPASGADFSFSLLVNVGEGSGTTTYEPGNHSFVSVADAVFPSRQVNFEVGPGQLGMHALIDWNASTFDFLVVWDVIQTGNIIDLVATDADGDGVRGFQLVSGPFAGMNMFMDATIVTPLPSAVWLFGSGLAGLVGAARRRPHASRCACFRR